MIRYVESMFISIMQIRRAYSTVDLVAPLQYHPNYGPEITLYIKGFLSRGEKADDFRKWLYSHERITMEHGWDPLAKGWNWDCGRLKYPIPFASSAHLAYSLYKKTKYLRLNPILAVAGAAFDISLYSGRMMYEYFHAEKNTELLAPNLRNDLIGLSLKYDKVRVVAHSLGCKLLLNAIKDIPAEYKPDTIHLCAPAFSEKEFEDVLWYPAKDKTYLYHTKHDQILAHGLRSVKNHHPVGAYGLEKKYYDLVTVDVSNHFENFWIVHNRFNTEFCNIVHPEKRLID